MTSTSNKWSRPASVPVPTVWREPVGLKLMADGKIPRFVIQDVPDDVHEEIIQFMTEHFLRDKPLCASINFKDEEESVRELHDVWRSLLKQHAALVAFLKQDDPTAKPRIAGCNVTGVSYKSKPLSPAMFSGKKMRRVFEDLEYAGQIKDPYLHYDVTEYMTALGLCVDPMFRGQGLGLELLRARFDFGKAVGLKATVTVFTAIASQKLAAKVGMEILAVVPYEEFRDDEGKLVYKGIESKDMKIMGKKIE